MNQIRQAIPHSHASHWLLAYDIRDPKRLQRVWRCLRQEGVRLQYSVYLLTGSRRHIEQLLAQLQPIIDERVDDVRVYPLSENTKIWGLGTQFEDGGNTLCDEFIDKLIQSNSEVTDDQNMHAKLSFWK